MKVVGSCADVGQAAVHTLIKAIEVQSSVFLTVLRSYLLNLKCNKKLSALFPISHVPLVSLFTLCLTETDEKLIAV